MLEPIYNAELNENDVIDPVEQEITSILRAKKSEISSRNIFRIAEDLIDTAVATIVTLRRRVATLEAEQHKFSSQERQWQSLLDKWRDNTKHLKDHVRDLEIKLAQANQRELAAGIHARTIQDDTIVS